MIVSDDIKESIDSLLIDEERQYAITKNGKTKNGLKKTESDHNVLISKFKFKWNKKIRKTNIELFNMKNEECQLIFKESTSNSDFLSSVFDSDKNINSLTKKFLNQLNGVIHSSFKRVRINDKPNDVLEELFRRRKVLRTKTDAGSKVELEKVEMELDEKCAEENKEKILKEHSGMKCEEGGIHSGNLWKLRKKLFPKSRDPPTAMCDSEGNLVTEESEIEKIAIETYLKRLSNRPMKPELESIRKEKEELCTRRLKETRKNKSREPFGYTNEIFRMLPAKISSLLS